MNRLGSILGIATCAARTAADRLRGRPLRPAWSPLTELVARAMKAEFHSTREIPLPALRAHIDGLVPPAMPWNRVPRTLTRLGGVPAHRLAPAGAAQGAALLYLHGGGYVFGSFRSHGAFVSALAKLSGLLTWFPEYRLAPEHPFPAALEDALAAYEAILGAGQDPARLVVAGESAGGGLTLALLIRLRELGRPLPAAAALISPWVDHTLASQSIDRNAPYDFADRALARRWSEAYLGDTDPRHPLVSPLFADLTGLPPLLVQVGGAELLHDEVEALAARASAQGVPVTFTDWPDQFHVWHFALDILPEGAEATGEIARFLRAHASRRA